MYFEVCFWNDTIVIGILYCNEHLVINHWGVWKDANVYMWLTYISKRYYNYIRVYSYQRNKSSKHQCIKDFYKITTKKSTCIFWNISIIKESLQLLWQLWTYNSDKVYKGFMDSCLYDIFMKQLILLWIMPRLFWRHHSINFIISFTYLHDFHLIILFCLNYPFSIYYFIIIFLHYYI